MTTDSNKYNLPLIRFDQTSKKLIRPTLLLKTRTGEFIGKIKYDNFKCSFVGNGLDEISFDVHKMVDNELCPFWDKLIDLTIIDYEGYGQFEASFSVNDSDETVKTCTAVSLETELGQRILREFHVNDEHAIEFGRKEKNGDKTTNIDFTQNGKFIPTVLYDSNDTKHSLLHRVIKDKAPHWSIGHVSSFFKVGKQVYSADKFQRTYTVDGTSIYDFLTGEVAEETNCVFVFNTYDRTISCYNLEECVYITTQDEDGKKSYTIVDDVYYYNGGYYYKKDDVKIEDSTGYGHCESIGHDTNIFLSKNKLAQDFQLQSDKDGIKNCFYVTGGDDTINNWIPAANITSDNYIMLFDQFQLDDMPKELTDAFLEYTKFYNEEKEKYIGKNGLFLSYCKLQDDYYYENNSKFPNISLPETSAENELNKITEHFKNDANPVIITNAFSETSFAHVTATVESMLHVLCDSRYDLKLLNDSTHTISVSDLHYEARTDANGQSINVLAGATWHGCIKITKTTKESENIISDTIAIKITVIPEDDYDKTAAYIKQKMAIAVAKMSIADLDYSSIPDGELTDFFRQYNLTSLKSYTDAFKSCLDQLESLVSGMDMSVQTISDTYTAIKNTYQTRYDACMTAYKEAQSKVAKLSSQIDEKKSEIEKFKESINMQNYFEDNYSADLWTQLQLYIREDEYNNSNYISDGLSDGEILDKAKELLDIAEEELKKACAIQKTISGNIYNLFSLDELSMLYPSFSLFNYIHARVDDEVYKLRLVQIDFDENSPTELNVVFSDSIESVDSEISDTKSILQQASAIATSYSSTAKQAKQGSDAMNTFYVLKDEGLSSAEYIIKNNADEEIVIDNTGITCKSMNDEGCYGDHQLKIMGNMIALTDDAWASKPRMALGRIRLNKEYKYGIVADAIVTDSLSAICANLGTITSGTIYSSDYNSSNNTATTVINLDDGTFSFANGNLTYKDSALTVKGKIYATNSEFTGAIQSGSSINCGDTFSVNSNGYLQTTAGKIGGWEINSNSLSSGTGACILCYNGNESNSASMRLIDGKMIFDEYDSDSKYFSTSNGYSDISKLGVYAKSAASSNGYLFAADTPNNKIFIGHDDNTTEIYLKGNCYINGYKPANSTRDLIADNGEKDNIIFYGALDDDGTIADRSKIAVSRYWYEAQEKSSDFRLKRDITPINSIKDIYLNFKPKQYRFKDNTQINADKLHSGLLAQQVISNFEKHGYNISDFDIVEEYENRQGMDEGLYTDNGKSMRINYDNLHAYHIAFGQEIYKELTDEIASLKQENTETKQELSSLKQEIEELKKLIKQS